MAAPAPRPPEVMRSVNELIAASLATGGRTEQIAFFCECGEPGCYRSVWLTPVGYEAGKLDPAWSALASGHAASAYATAPSE